ncbi:hypothetical protein IV49_GL002082 [Kandleria vitulina DSM 20405]|uniref:Polysaccharide pyruvyl transferase domain-containing protein n=1 Tax=Kandleria vitulina DSM 20405 TaxID=1410657 RepID=A0A0R2HBV4_9FIRM|nr:polysaccharide pyruvyl transferase family protein [Kandleria vitulina]KRN50434.1 hypothetical protein IV49_GL002082 [Kandleria vitulina DSM 20405]
MKKIGIVTIIGDYNYGNRLQNYALYAVLKSLKYDVETINFKYMNCNVKNRIKILFRDVVVFLGLGRYKRNKKFRDFNKMIPFSKNIYNNTKIEVDKYEYFVCGSDQVWNYHFNEFGDNTLLKFSQKEKNIAYAASYGVSSIPKEYEEIYITGLNNFKSISLREQDGQVLTEKLIGKKCPVVLDPTLLLSREEWDSLVKSKIIKRKYILVYVLGDKLKNIERLFGNNFEIIYMNDRNNKDIYSCGPNEFLGLIKNAEFIITDSYHACIFSIIFEKKFAILDRMINNKKHMEGRINTLLKMVELNSLKINSIDEIVEKDLLNKNIDYDKCKKIINNEKDKSLKYLKDSLNR